MDKTTAQTRSQQDTTTAGAVNGTMSCRRICSVLLEDVKCSHAGVSLGSLTGLTRPGRSGLIRESVSVTGSAGLGRTDDCCNSKLQVVLQTVQ